MVKRMEFRNGFLKMYRLGPVTFGPQKRWGRAPKSIGLWAFPYPFYDVYFTYHKYVDAMGDRNAYDEETAAEWIKKNRDVVKLRTFWYSGDVFAHFTPAGEIADPGTFTGTPEWHRMSVGRLYEFIKSSGGEHTLARFGPDAPLKRFRTSVDHLELFIAPGMGTIKNRM
tara:strand:+ start:171 stop:677 length:507 start_codon:yes stop_codon:yes gene_type:complete